MEGLSGKNIVTGSGFYVGLAGSGLIIKSSTEWWRHRRVTFCAVGPKEYAESEVYSYSEICWVL